MAAALAPFCVAGDAILLKGPARGGKTAFVQELVAALGSKAEVTSPTFTSPSSINPAAGTFCTSMLTGFPASPSFAISALEDFVPESITAVSGATSSRKIFQALTIAFEFVPNQDNWRKLTFSAAAERWQPVLVGFDEFTAGHRVVVE